jgi:hypothetical protein
MVISEWLGRFLTAPQLVVDEEKERLKNISIRLGIENVIYEEVCRDASCTTCPLSGGKEGQCGYFRLLHRIVVVLAKGEPICRNQDQ